MPCKLEVSAKFFKTLYFLVRSKRKLSH